MPDLAHPFDAQFDSPAEFDEILDEIKRSYTISLAYGDDDAAEAAVEYLLDTYDDWKVEPTREDIERLAAPHMEEIESGVPARRREIERDEMADRFFELRREGRSVASIARTLGVEPATLALTVSGVPFVDAKQAGAEVAHKIRVEEVRQKAYRARARLLSKLTRKIETALEKRDLSDVPTEKLVEMMLRMAELSKAEEPPKPALFVRNQLI